MIIIHHRSADGGNPDPKHCSVIQFGSACQHSRINCEQAGACSFCCGPTHKALYLETKGITSMESPATFTLPYTLPLLYGQSKVKM